MGAGLSHQPRMGPAPTRIATPPPGGGRELPPPVSDPDPLPGGEKDQEPAGPAGVQVSGRGEPEGSLPAPTLDAIRPEDLRDTGRALDLHRQAVARRLVGSSEADRLRFLAAVEHARAVGRANPCGLLARTIRRGWWHFATQADEDAANLRLKRHLWGGPSPTLSAMPGPRPTPAGSPTIPDDVRVVREVRMALFLAGFKGDAFEALRSRDASWTRERWDRALAGGMGSTRERSIGPDRGPAHRDRRVEPLDQRDAQRG